MITKIYNGKIFILVYHLVTNELSSSFFPTLEAANLSVNNFDQYSILQLIDEDPSFKGKSGYEFLLEYPERIDHLYHWRQDISPFKITSETTFEEINFFNYSAPFPYFRGLYGLTGASTVLRGKCEDHDCEWWFAVGVNSTHYTPNFPGPINLDKLGIKVHECFLWLRFIHNKTLNAHKPRITFVYLVISILI